jgi:hypothetical protein
MRRYRVTDPYLRFWFRFVEPHLAGIARGRADLAVASLAAGWPPWRGVVIEPVVREAHRVSPRAGGGSASTIADSNGTLRGTIFPHELLILPCSTRRRN